MNNKNHKKGFTLAELLIVVAIIAVLVAVAIPVFTAQLEKASEATDIANLRSAYAFASAALLTEEYLDSTKWDKENDDPVYYTEYDLTKNVVWNDRDQLNNIAKAKNDPNSRDDFPNLSEGICYGGAPAYDYGSPDEGGWIRIAVNPETGKVCVSFRSEYDAGFFDGDFDKIYQ